MYTTKNKSNCTNCGNFGHNYKQCLDPITSYGMIIFRVNGGWNQADQFLTNSSSITGLEQSYSNIEYLLIQRKDSLGFVEIMRGKYKLQDIDYIKHQLAGTTAEERVKLLTVPFDDLWIGLWGRSTAEQGQAYKNEKENSRSKLMSLRDGYYDEVSKQTITLAGLLEKIPLQWATPEWGFPKGRRDFRENEYRCALREVKEETSLTENDILPIKNLLPIQESFFGSNNIHYSHKYYLSYMPVVKSISLDTKNEHMMREIGNIGWFRLEEALRMIRPDNVEKREILLKASSLLRNYCPLSLSLPKVENGAV